MYAEQQGPETSERRGCKCGCDQRVREEHAFAQRDFALWLAARDDPNDWSYADALAAAQAREAERAAVADTLAQMTAFAR